MVAAGGTADGNRIGVMSHASGHDWGVPLFTPEQLEAETRQARRSRTRRRLVAGTGSAAAVLLVTAAGAVLLLSPHQASAPRLALAAATLSGATPAGSAPTPTPALVAVAPTAIPSAEPILTTTVRITVTKVSVMKELVTSRISASSSVTPVGGGIRFRAQVLTDGRSARVSAQIGGQSVQLTGGTAIPGGFAFTRTVSTGPGTFTISGTASAGSLTAKLPPSSVTVTR